MNEAVMQHQGRLLGLDYGSKRIGVAMSDPMGIIATALTVVENTPKAIETLSELVQEHGIQGIVVGMPLNLKGEQGKKAEEVEAFIANLKKQVLVPVVQLDERFTTRIATDTIRAMGGSRKRREEKGQRDRVAAALILQGYLDRQRYQQRPG